MQPKTIAVASATVRRAEPLKNFMDALLSIQNSIIGMPYPAIPISVCQKP
jgi:hypothetical protein